MQQTIEFIKKELSGIYPENEIRSFQKIIFQHVCGYSFTQQVLNNLNVIDPDHKKEIRQIVQRLKEGEPIQYIIGQTEFFGLFFEVNKDVLIPRAETEELVSWILQLNQQNDVKILDIGTGSGCIAITLKKNLPDSEISGIDISDIAIDIAQKNAQRNGVDVNWLVRDIFKWNEFDWEEFDIVVSNPPYVTCFEMMNIHRNVLDFEPEQALFVNDDKPLLYYESIVNFTKKNLKEGGFVFFEINEKFGIEVCELLKKTGFRNIELSKDLNGKDRMVKAIR